MKRTPLWVFVAAVGLQIAALGLCVWVMERLCGQGHEEESHPDQAPPREAVSPAPPPVAKHVVFSPPLPPQAERPPVIPPTPLFGPPPVRAAEPKSEPRIHTRPLYEAPEQPRRVPPPPAPSTVAEHSITDERVPAFIAEAADGTTQIVRSSVAGRPVAFGFYPDGNIRFVDVDGGRYAGKADSARARMREVDGSRAFTVQIGVASDGRLQATFTGGLHDSETLPLEPLVGWTVA